MSEERPCILVIDDDAACARLVELSFRPSGVRVIRHGRAFGVLELIASHRPALVVLDVMMPGLDGPSLVELIREDPELSGTRVVLWSALDREELEARGQHCGADGVIPKIAGPKVLVDQLSDWLLRWDGLELR